MPASQIYGFEACVEPAAQTALAAMVPPVTCATSQDAPKFQSQLPRCEVTFSLGPGQNRFVAIDPATGLAPVGLTGFMLGNQTMDYARESAWACTLSFACLTNADVAEHNAYLTQCRAALASIWLTINETATMTRHRLSFVSDGGNSQRMQSEDKAMFLTTIILNAKIAVQANAWPALITTE